MGPGGYPLPTTSDAALPAVPPWALSLQNGGRRASSGDLLTSQNVADSTVMSMPDLTSRAQSGPEMTTLSLATKSKIPNGGAAEGSSSRSSIEVIDEDDDDNDDTESEASEAESPEPARIMSDIMTEAAHNEAAPGRVQSEPSAATKPQGKSFASSSKIMALEGLWQEQHARDQAAQNHTLHSTTVNAQNNAVNSMIPASKPSISNKRRLSGSSSSGSDIPDYLPARQSSTISNRDPLAPPFPEHKRMRIGEVNGVSDSTDIRLTEQDLKKALLVNKSLPSDSGQASMGGTSDSDNKPSRATAKATPISRRLNNVPSFELSDEDEDFEDADGEDDDDEEEDVEPSRGDSTVTEEQNTPVPASSTAEGVPPEQILYATDGRLYTTFPGLDSGSTGKTNGAVFPTGYKLYDSPVTPFICAIRDCQRLLPTIMSLGAHYGAKHCRKTFNDNLDGTMSYVGTYTTPRGVSAPPIIVSQRPPGPNAPPPAEAMVPAYVMGRIRDAQYVGIGKKKSKIHERPHMMVTMKVPKQKDISSSATPPAAGASRNAERQNSGSHLKNTYHNKTASTKPKWNTPPADTTSNNTPPDPLPDYGPRLRRRAAIDADAAIQASASGVLSAAPKPSAVSQPDRPILPAQPHPATTQMTLDAGNLIPSNILEMEEWEVAPGRIRDESGAIAENIAFSNSFVGSTQEIPISSDVSFNVLTIKPGGSVQFQANIGKLRVCSLAAGKLQVKMGPHEFAIGPNGMFKVRDSDSAVITNRLYLDSVLHVSSIKEY